MKRIIFSFLTVGMIAGGALLFAKADAQNRIDMSPPLDATRNFIAVDNTLSAMTAARDIEINDVSTQATSYNSAGVTGHVIAVAWNVMTAVDSGTSFLMAEVGDREVAGTRLTVVSTIEAGKVQYLDSIHRTFANAIKVTPGTKLECGTTGGSSGSARAMCTFVIRQYPTES